MNGIEAFDQTAVAVKEIDLREKLSALNKEFKSKLEPENGTYGVQEILKDNGILERIGKNEAGHAFKEYYHEGRLFLKRENLGGGKIVKTEFDDFEKPYCETITLLGGNRVLERRMNLFPNTEIIKGNYSALTDMYGRPVLNRITDFSLNHDDHGSVTQFRDSSYRPDDDGGHLIPHSFCGPGSKENVIAQNYTVNRGAIKRVENIARKLKLEGHTVDYEIKTNYIGKDIRPASFEPTIYVDGEKYLLPAELKKIYNEANNSYIGKVLTSAEETITFSHGLSIKPGIDAAALTVAVSAADNIGAFLGGEISVEEMAAAIVKDTAAAGALGYGSTFLETTISQAMGKSSVAMIRSIGGSCLPAAAVSFAVDSYGAVSQYAQGEIDGTELMYELGDSAASIAGGLGGAQGGAVVGAIVAGPLGAAVGGIAGSLVGCALSSEAYAAAVEVGSEYAASSAEHTEQFMKETISYVEEYAPEKLDSVKQTLSEYIQENRLPFRI